jgi:hypothetical protein
LSSTGSNPLRFQGDIPPGDLEDTWVTISTSDTFPNTVNRIYYEHKWGISLDGCRSWGILYDSRGQEERQLPVFLTYKTPLEPLDFFLTAKRMWWVTDAAAGGSDIDGVAAKMHKALADYDPPYEPGDKKYPGFDWMLLDAETYGGCNTQASLMMKALGYLGIESELECVHASRDGGAGSCLRIEWDIKDGKKWWLMLDSDPGSGIKLNAFEGCCVVNSRYYAVWPKQAEPDDYEMLRALDWEQVWIRTRNDVDPSKSPGWELEEIGDPEERPWE